MSDKKSWAKDPHRPNYLGKFWIALLNLQGVLREEMQDRKTAFLNKIDPNQFLQFGDWEATGHMTVLEFYLQLNLLWPLKGYTDQLMLSDLLTWAIRPYRRVWEYLLLQGGIKERRNFDEALENYAALGMVGHHDMVSLEVELAFRELPFDATSFKNSTTRALSAQAFYNGLGILEIVLIQTDLTHPWATPRHLMLAHDSMKAWNTFIKRAVHQANSPGLDSFARVEQAEIIWALNKLEEHPQRERLGDEAFYRKVYGSLLRVFGTHLNPDLPQADWRQLYEEPMLVAGMDYDQQVQSYSTDFRGKSKDSIIGFLNLMAGCPAHTGKPREIVE